MTYAYLTIVALIVAIVLAFIKKTNIGLLAIAFAYIIGKAAGMKDSAIFKGFPYTLFLLIFGVMFLFAIAQENQAMSLLVKKILRRTGKQAWLIPIAQYVLFLAITGLGAGPYAVLALNALLSVSLAKELNKSPIFFLMIGGYGIGAGCCSPISLGGLVFGGLLPAINYEASVVAVAFKNVILCETIIFLITYIVFRGWKLKPAEEVNREVLPRFNKQQVITLIAILIFVVIVIFGYNPGGVGLIMGMILVFMKVADEKAVIRAIPWGTIIMLCGVSLLINVMTATGGTEMITNLMASAVSARTVVPFMTFVGGIFSIFTVMSSVVIPTLTPMLPAIISSVGGDSTLIIQLVGAILFAGYATGVSPFSTGGGMYLAALASMDEETKGAANMNYFLTFLGLAAAFLVVSVIFAFLGLFGIFV